MLVWKGRPSPSPSSNKVNEGNRLIDYDAIKQPIAQYDETLVHAVQVGEPRFGVLLQYVPIIQSKVGI